jgi:hypothetical protein
LEAFAPLHSFEIETEIQYFAPLSIVMRPRAGGETGVEVDESELRAFVNPAEWNLGSSKQFDFFLMQKNWY